MQESLFKLEQHGHHHQRHVMMPAAPVADLVVSQTEVLFSGLQGPLHPVTLPLHESQAGDRCLRRGITQALFEFGRGGHLATDDQMP